MHEKPRGSLGGRRYNQRHSNSGLSNSSIIVKPMEDLIKAQTNHPLHALLPLSYTILLEGGLAEKK